MSSLNKVRYQQRTSCEFPERCSGNCRDIAGDSIVVHDHETNTGDYEVVYCRRRKFAFTDPFPTEETARYLYEGRDSSDFDTSGKIAVFDVIKDCLAGRELRRMARFKGLRKVSSFLDFGAGNGRFALIAGKVFQGAQVYAADFPAEPPEFLKNNPDDRLRYVPFDEILNSDVTFDIIMLRHVLEHVHHPLSLVKILAGKLNKTGILCIETPNVDSGCAKLFKKYWLGYYVPRHIFHFGIDSLKLILNNANLQYTIARTDPPFIGKTISIILHARRYNLLYRIIGILFYPVQLFIERVCMSSSGISAVCTLRYTDYT
ncbi:MAG: class I SAM-dependent methyltransferase [Candidatus Omnitrophota bacterium]